MTTPQSRKEMRAALADAFIGRRKALYVTTQNPIHAWAAYRHARRLAVPIPDWVLACFDTAAAKMLVQTDPASSPTPIAEALGLATRRGPSAVRRARTADRNLGLVDAVLTFQRGQKGQHKPMLDELAFAEVATQFNEGLPAPAKKIREATVKKIYYELTVNKHTKPARSRR